MQEKLRVVDRKGFTKGWIAPSVGMTIQWGSGEMKVARVTSKRLYFEPIDGWMPVEFCATNSISIDVKQAKEFGFKA